MKKNTSLTLIIALLLLVSCQQEISDIINQAQQCRIQTGLYYGGSGVVNDSATFSYDASGKLVKWETADGAYNFFYSGNNISARKYVEMGDLLYEDSVFYDASNRITSLVVYDYTGMWADTVQTRYNFEYTNNRLTRLYSIDYWSSPWGMQTDTTPSSYHWNAAGNIEKITIEDMSGIAYDSILFQYNTHPNYFKLIHPHFFLFDPGFQLHAGLEPHLAYFYSTNNVTDSNIYGTFDNPIDYGLDSTNKVTAVKMGGFDYMEYKYSCP